MPATFVNLTTDDELEALLRESFNRPIALLKHSNSCGTSFDVMYQLEEIEGEINVIVVQQHRSLSNAVAEKLNHRHQSPQAFIIKDGRSVYHATHYGIDPTEIQKRLQDR